MKQTIDLVASDFTVDLSKTYSLSIRQFPDGYSFCVTDDEKNKCLAIKFVKSIKTTHDLDSEPLLQLQYRNVFFYGYGDFALVPETFIINNNYSTFLPEESFLRNRAKCVINKINENSLVISHANQWSQPSSSVESHHEIELLIMMALKSSNDQSVWVEVCNNRINIVVICNGKLFMANSYRISAATDASYFIMLCYQKFSLSYESTALFITGDLITINPTDFLSNYIRHINLLRPSMWNNDFNNNYASFFTLQIQSFQLCE